jgi:hypothetical protein
MGGTDRTGGSDDGRHASERSAMPAIRPKRLSKGMRAEAEGGDTPQNSVRAGCESSTGAAGPAPGRSTGSREGGCLPPRFACRNRRPRRPASKFFPPVRGGMGRHPSGSLVVVSGVRSPHKINQIRPMTRFKRLTGSVRCTSPRFRELRKIHLPHSGNASHVSSWRLPTRCLFAPAWSMRSGSAIASSTSGSCRTASLAGTKSGF